MRPKTLFPLLLAAFSLAVLAVPACAAGAGDTSLSMPVRGVWMHPGFFGPDRSKALEKMRTTLDE